MLCLAKESKMNIYYQDDVTAQSDVDLQKNVLSAIKEGKEESLFER